MDEWKKARNRVYLLESLYTIRAKACYGFYHALEMIGLENSCIGRMVAGELQVTLNTCLIFSDGLFRNWDR